MGNAMSLVSIRAHAGRVQDRMLKLAYNKIKRNHTFLNTEI